MHGMKVGGSMGLTTWAAFSGSDELAAVDGDFIMTADEVQPVLRALRKANSCCCPAQPHGRRTTFVLLHALLGKGPAAESWQGLKAALDAQAASSKKGKH